jgi:hypothetical protein
MSVEWQLPQSVPLTAGSTPTEWHASQCSTAFFTWMTDASVGWQPAAVHALETACLDTAPAWNVPVVWQVAQVVEGVRPVVWHAAQLEADPACKVATFVPWHCVVQASLDVCGITGAGCSVVKSLKWQIVQSSDGLCSGLPWQAEQYGTVWPGHGAEWIVTTFDPWQPLFTQVATADVCASTGAGCSVVKSEKWQSAHTFEGV